MTQSEIICSFLPVHPHIHAHNTHESSRRSHWNFKELLFFFSIWQLHILKLKRANTVIAYDVEGIIKLALRCQYYSMTAHFLVPIGRTRLEVTLILTQTSGEWKSCWRNKALSLWRARVPVTYFPRTLADMCTKHNNNNFIYKVLPHWSAWGIA